MFDYLAYTIIGFIIGIITGTIPGLHINLVASIFAYNFKNLEPFIPLLISMSISHNFFEFIPTVYLSTPEDDTALVINPIKKYVVNGKANYALKLLSLGGLFSIFTTFAIISAIVYIIKYVYTFFKKYIFILLILITIHLIIKDKNKKKSFILFILSGILGYFVLRKMYVNQPLLPLLTGLFGVPSLIENIKSKITIPKPIKIYGKEYDNKDIIKGSILASLSSIILGIVPAIGPAQAGIIAKDLTKEKDEKRFIISIGGINTSDVVVSIFTLYTINKARSGVLEIIKNINYPFLLMIFSVIISSTLSFYFLNKISDKISKNLYKVNYKILSYVVLFFISFLTFLFSNFKGLIILFLSSIIGLLAKNNNKVHLMGCLTIPTLSYYLKF